MFPEPGHELGSSIGHDCVWQAMQLPDMTGVQAGDFFGVAGSLAAYEMFHFGQAVYDDKDSVVSVA
jgi:hypothetical protein